MTLEKIIFDFKGVKVNVCTERKGVMKCYGTNHALESPLQLVEVELETSAGKAKTNMRYDADKGVFADYLSELFDDVNLPKPVATDTEEDEFRLKVSEVYTFLVRNGYTRFKPVRTE